MISAEHLSGITAFVQAADAGGFTLAAERLGLSKSGIAKSVARVELADEKSVSDTKPAWRAAIEIEFDERDPGRGAAGGSPIHVYEFKLDLGI